MPRSFVGEVGQVDDEVELAGDDAVLGIHSDDQGAGGEGEIEGEGCGGVGGGASVGGFELLGGDVDGAHGFVGGAAEVVDLAGTAGSGLADPGGGGGPYLSLKIANGSTTNDIFQFAQPFGSVGAGANSPTNSLAIVLLV